jgi:hypothetical protein
MPATIEFDAKLSGQGTLMREMRASAKALGLSVAGGVKFTGWAVADAFRTATKESPKKRKITEVKGARTKAGNKTFEVERWHRGKKTTFLVYAKNKREANKLPQVKIGNRGLARKAWHFPQRKLGSARGGGKVGTTATRIARRHGTVELHLRDENPSVKITNSLDYAADAFKTSGQQTINNVLERAARRMQKMTAAKVAKRMGAK